MFNKYYNFFLSIQILFYWLLVIKRHQLILGMTFHDLQGQNKFVLTEE